MNGYTSLKAQTAREAAAKKDESIPDKLRQLAALKDEGVLTEEEFDKKKKDLLGRM